jgi:NAD(P)-dependent dehydrogenase (short-subunit alcohol dehydrogenase family)
MSEDFSGKVALVTGGGNGIGAATCRAFAAVGAHVVVLDRDAAAAERVAAEITGRNGKAEAYGLDVSDREGFARLAAGITEAAGGIDILVSGARVTVRRMIGEMGAEDWDRVIAVNLTGAFNGIRAVLPHMRARGGGAIVNIATIAGQRISFGGTANYSASKAGLLGFTRHAAYELAPDHIGSTPSVPARRPQRLAERCRPPKARRSARARRPADQERHPTRNIFARGSGAQI